MVLLHYSSLIFVVLLSTITHRLVDAFAVPKSRPLPRQSWECYAQKKSSPSRNQQSTQSFAVSVDSSSSEEPVAAAEESSSPQLYLDPPAATRRFPMPLLELPKDMNTAEFEQLMHKSINALILTLAFGFAIYAIVNIDAGMTRGWTQSEIAMRIPLDTWSSYEVALEEKPIVTKTIINVVIYLLGDWLSQTVFQKKNVLEFDALRTLRNGFIGLCFGPLVVYYYQFSDHILPLDGGMTNRVGKILMDQTVYLSVKCSLYIMAVGVLQGDGFATSAQNVKDKIKGIVFTAWKFWPLVHCITYSVIPAQHRILWVNAVDLVWNAILATISQKDAAPVDDDSAAAAIEQSFEAEIALVEDTFDELVAATSSGEVVSSGQSEVDSQNQRP